MPRADRRWTRTRTTLFDLADERPLPRARRRLPWFRMSRVFRPVHRRRSPIWPSRRRPCRSPDAARGRSRHSADRAPAHLADPQSRRTAYGLDKTLGPAIAEARQHSGGGREDTLVVGAPGDVPLCPRDLRATAFRSRRAASTWISCAAPPRPASRSSATARPRCSRRNSDRSKAPPSRWRARPSRTARPSASATTMRRSGSRAGSADRACSAQRVACFLDAMTALGTGSQRLGALCRRRAQPRRCCAPEARNVRRRVEARQGVAGSVGERLALKLRDRASSAMPAFRRSRVPARG